MPATNRRITRGPAQPNRIAAEHAPDKNPLTAPRSPTRPPFSFLRSPPTVIQVTIVVMTKAIGKPTRLAQSTKYTPPNRLEPVSARAIPADVKNLYPHDFTGTESGKFAPRAAAGAAYGFSVFTKYAVWSVCVALYELHDSIEQPGRVRAQSGRFLAKSSLSGCSSYGCRSNSSNSLIRVWSPCSDFSIASAAI